MAGEDVTDRTTTPSLQQCRDRMRAARAREFESVDFMDRLREIGVQFRLHMDHASNDQSRFLLMLYTDYTLDLLARFGNTLTLLDGTFSLVESKLITHIFAVEHGESGQLCPCVFAIMDRQDEAAYVAMFEYVFHYFCLFVLNANYDIICIFNIAITNINVLCFDISLHRLLQQLQPSFAPSYMLTDMERAYDCAMQKVWPETVHIICWFHVQQAIVAWYDHKNLCMSVGMGGDVCLLVAGRGWQWVSAGRGMRVTVGVC